MEPFLAGLLIFGLRIVDVSTAILRILMVIRGRKALAWLFGFAQAFVYIIAIREVMADLGNWINILAYAAGFATGTVVGIWVEERLAIGFGHVRIMSPRLGSSLTERLREAGYGVTVFPGRGKDGIVDVLIITVSRRQIRAISRLVEETDPAAFITVENVRPLRKGFL
ncbi:MAG TPA: DUF5698 domain-containing protein [Anaerolineales bacterium]|nr:DUF5698 domain-containing protein [Anaerolineales bacterium]